MKHPSIRELFDYWEERRGGRMMPERAEIEPGAIRRALADTFILSFEPSSGHPFRLAGTRVCALFGREIKGEAFVHLFAHGARREMRELLAITLYILPLGPGAKDGKLAVLVAALVFTVVTGAQYLVRAVVGLRQGEPARSATRGP